MWDIKFSDWHSSHSALSKYFIERIKQKVDPLEIISNKHKTTNGFSLIAEIKDVIEITLKRKKSLNRLVSLFEEAKSRMIDSSVVNDCIIQNYYPEIISFFDKVNIATIRENDLSFYKHTFQLFYTRLSDDYYKYLQDEFSKINFLTDHFERTSKQIDRLIDCLIPTLLFKGFSTQSISEISYWYVRKKEGIKSAEKFLKIFSRDNNICEFLFIVPSVSEEFEFLKRSFVENNVDFKEISLNEIKAGFLDEAPEIKDGYVLYSAIATAKDPHNYLRDLHEITMKSYVISQERLSLNFFNDFLDNTFWRFSKGTGDNYHKFRTTKIRLDPINVKYRPSTLRHTLVHCSSDYRFEFGKHDFLPPIKSISESVYYYNMALRSKSIENSLSLLWTSLESLVPFRFKEVDIENVQHFVSTSLSFGVIGRQLFSLVNKIIKTAIIEGIDPSKWNLPTDKINLDAETLNKWTKWFCRKFPEQDDPYDIFKQYSELLCSRFTKINTIYSGNNSDYKGCKYFLYKIEKSETAIKYQLDRIYLHRNQIIHSGKIINEYSNLWSHLEWYVGKLLSYCYIKHFEEKKDDIEKEQIFLNLEHDSAYIKNILKINEKNDFESIEQHFNLLFKHSWQFF